MKYEIPDNESQVANEAAVAYVLPQHDARQQATMDAIMLMYSTLDKVGMQLIKNRINNSDTVTFEEADRILAEKLKDLPSWDETEHTDMNSITKADYSYAIRQSRRRAMKGIEKWL